jgi:DNA-binding beta-propeller fold protein YncE
LAIASNGDVYVADTGNHRIDEFSSSGAFIRAFGVGVGGNGIDVCSTSCREGTATEVPGGLIAPTFISVDHLGGESPGDVYVGDRGDSLVSKFSADGQLESTWATHGQLGGFTNHGEGVLAGIATALNGDLFAIETNELRFWFDESGASKMAPCFTELVEPPGLALDGDNDLFFLEAGTVREFSDSCEKVGGEIGGERRGEAVAIDSFNNDLYLTQKAEVGEGGDVQVFAPTCSFRCTPLEEFAFEPGELKAPQGLAVDPTTHTVYVADSSSNQIDVYTLQNVEPPTATPPVSSEVAFTSAKVTAKVDPNGHVTTCRFEYSLEASFGTAKSTPCASNPGNGSSSVEVEAELTGLRGSAEYHVRLVAENRGIPGNTTPSSAVSFSTLTVAPPTVGPPIISAVGATSAHFSGQVNPNAPGGNPAAFDVRWHFECSPACPGLIGGTVPAGGSTSEVSETASGLQPGQEYKVVLSGVNANEVPVTAGPVSFTTPAIAPSVIASTVASASATEATLSSQLDPGGAPTTYHYDYITEAQFLADGVSFGEGTQSTPEQGPIGTPGDNQEHEASAAITGLQANTNYRFRIVAENDITTVEGPAELLFTHSPEGPKGCINETLRIENDSEALPDCRAYEQVSPGDNAEAFVPFGQNIEAEGLVSSQWPMQGSASGQALAYVAEPPSSGAGEGTGNAGAGEGDEQLASRTSSGWSVTDIQPLASSAETSYQAFSPSLQSGVLRTGKEEAVQSGIPSHCDQLYSRPGTGSFGALFQAQGSCQELSNFFVGGSSDYSQIAFESKETLAEGAIASSGELGHENLYISSGGEVHTVNVLPGASPSPAPNSSIGALSSEPDILAGGGSELPALGASNAVAANGSTIFWTNLANGILYARINPAQEQSEVSAGKCSEAERACTQQVSSGSATYQTATPDGHYAYYTEAGKLFRYDTQAESRQELAGAGAGVQGVVGVNEAGEDGAYLYFVAEGKLASGAEARKCEAAPEGVLRGEEEEGKAPSGFGCNLYELHEGATSLVAVLSAGDDEFAGNTTGTSQPKKGDWRPVAGYRPAELAADGQSLIFMSGRKLTSYRNVNIHGECGGGIQKPTHSCIEIYRYSAQSGQIACASCNPSGAPPVKAKDAPNQEGRATYLPGDFGSITHQRRLISANGDRVFFNSDQALAPEDANGVQDVYQWEAPGTGSCTAGSSANGGGCVSLLSGGTSTSGSLLLDASESGDDAFFVTRAGLVPGDKDEKPDVYDVREGGGFPVAAQPKVCVEGEPGCPSRSASSAPAPTLALGSAIFSGEGNLSPMPLVVKPEPGLTPAQVRAKALTKALKTCKAKKRKSKRKACEATARKRYGPVTKKKAAAKKKTKAKKDSTKKGSTKKGARR